MSSFSFFSSAKATWALLVALAVPTIVYRTYVNQRRRVFAVQEIGERVLVLGGSSGIGRAISLQYAQRGAKLFVVGLRQTEVDSVIQECANLHPGKGNVLGRAADFTNVEDMIAIRTQLKESWNGVDTVIVCAGVSSLRPLLDVAGVPHDGTGNSEASAEGIQHAVEVSNAALKVNFTGPLMSAVTFIPLLEATSRSPAMLLIASLAAVVPAPTRSLYCSTKAAALVLYQSLAIEHPKVAFSCALPATVEGNFRASAVDTTDRSEMTPSRGQKKEVVASRCIAAIDNREKTFFVPALYGRLGHFVYWLFPSITEYFAAKKYGFRQ